MMNVRYRRPGVSALALVLVIGLLLLGLALLAPAVSRVRSAAGRTQSMNNLKQLALACHNFHDVYKGMPPIAGKFGQMEGSLHYFLLPFIEQDVLFRNSNNAVWNNDTWAKNIPTFIDQRDPSAESDFVYQGWLATTSYPGNWMVFKEGKTSLAQIPDGTSNTLMYAQRYRMCNGDPTAWGYPGLYKYAPMFGFYSTNKFQAAPSQDACTTALPQAITPDGILVGMCDGSVRHVSPQVRDETWYYLTDPADGNAINEDF